MIEIFHGILEENHVVCPGCKTEGLKKLISSGGAVIIAGREANQFNDIHQAKCWRDKNGVRHKVESGDGHSGSATVSKQDATPEEVKAAKKRDARADKRRRSRFQKIRAAAFNREQLKKP